MKREKARRFAIHCLTVGVFSSFILWGTAMTVSGATLKASMVDDIINMDILLF